MKQLVVALLVLGAWVAATAAAAWAVPLRHNPDALPDLSLDEKWLLRVPPNPVPLDKVRPPTQPTTTTVAAQPAPVTPQPRPLLVAPPPSPRIVVAPGVEQWRGLVDDYPWPVETMLAIMRCESGGNPAARNRSGASGLFQLLPGPPGWQDPATNIRLAYQMKYVPSGLSPWNASRGCWG